MGHKVKQSLVNSRVDFFYYAFRNVLLVSIPLLVASGIVLSHLSSHSSATGSSSGTDNLTISISSACTLSSVVDSEHNASISAGTYKDNIGKTTIKTTCNDNNGYSIYANGYSNNKEGNNRLINTLSSSNVIETGLNTSGDISSWAMKLNNLPDDPSPTPPVIESAYDDTYGIIPSNWTKVLSLPSGSTDMSLGSSFTTTYAVYANSRQYTGTYQGQVKYLLTHPATQNSQLFMQDVVAIKNNLPNAGDSMQVVDQRDGKKYWVTKLKDGNIWMTSNLDLDIGGTNTAPLNSNNTDISIDPNVYASSGIYSDYNVSDGVYTWNPVSTAKTSSYYIDNTTVKPSAWPTDNNGQTKPYSAEGGDTYYYTSNSTSNDARYNSLQACKNANHTEAECKRYFAGNYYNWTAAIASNNSTNISTNGTIAANSICPKGWRLPNASPTDNEYNEFGRMLYKAGITAALSAALSAGNGSVGYKDGGLNKIRSNPYYFVRPGSINGGTLAYFGTDGFYWSSTANNNSLAYNLNFSSSEIAPARILNRSLGRSIRCVAR